MRSLHEAQRALRIENEKRRLSNQMFPWRLGALQLELNLWLFVGERTYVPVISNNA